MFDYSRTPVNKTSASVTSQSGCASDETLTDDQVRENLVARFKSIHDEIVQLPKGSAERKRLGKEQALLQGEISAIRPKHKCPGVEHYIIEILREELSAFEWNRLMTKASDRWRLNKND